MKSSKTKIPPKILLKKEEGAPVSVVSTIFDLYDHYQKHTEQSLKIIDCFIIFLMFSGAFQLLYCIVSGSYPFNAFLSGFFSTIGQIVFIVSLRFQLNHEDDKSSKKIPLERAFRDFIFGSIVLHFFTINFLG
ncbi:hypothetical protein PORY_000062 [Pneumocystis oryctolagi]|uniref:Uncharacterized protein n=1 Tax=Pneumocystis oryctolagi TaxID=42067 RepID=A0ACB7CGF3_9ASCO|nr:hypothetical protein PORY_000062 [Pneumocystis oryctolagi]